MGFWSGSSSGSSSKHIDHDDLESLFRKISVLGPNEREFLNGAFSKYSGKEISERDFNSVMTKLQTNSSDIIGPEEIRAIKSKAKEFFK